MRHQIHHASSEAKWWKQKIVLLMIKSRGRFSGLAWILLNFVTRETGWQVRNRGNWLTWLLSRHQAMEGWQRQAKRCQSNEGSPSGKSVKKQQFKNKGCLSKECTQFTSYTPSFWERKECEKSAVCFANFFMQLPYFWKGYFCRVFH